MSQSPRYPTIWKALEAIAGDNDLCLRPHDEVDWDRLGTRFKWPELEAQLGKLNEEDFALFVVGEYSVAADIADMKNLQDVDSMLNEVFCGDLYDTFYRR